MLYDKGQRRPQSVGSNLSGILLGIVLVPIAVLGWLKFGNVPVAAGDPPLPQERLLTGMPLNARIDRELVKTPPIQADEDNLVAGAEIYSDHCALCHGFHGKPSGVGTHMFPDAPPLWDSHHHNGVDWGERRSARRDLTGKWPTAFG